jgi:hypothetical protein
MDEIKLIKILRVLSNNETNRNNKTNIFKHNKIVIFKYVIFID